MTSPLEARLRSNLATAINASAKAYHSAEIACYWARIGEFEEAEELRKELRQNYGDGSDLSISILLITLEALLLYFKDLNPAARDRMARANLLSIASGHPKFIALTSAWMAHIDFNQNRFDTMLKSVSTCFDSLSGDDGTAECRIALVLGDMFAFCGQFSVSQQWYGRARIVAIRLGDQAAMGAITYNRAALRVAATRLSVIAAPPSPDEISAVWSEVKSAINYQVVAQLRSLAHLLSYAKIGALILQAKYEDALVEINSAVTLNSSSHRLGDTALLKSDQCLCFAAVGRLDEANDAIKSVTSIKLDELSSDDLAIIFRSLSMAFHFMSFDSEAASYAERSNQEFAKHSAFINGLREKFAQFSDLNVISR